MISHVYDSFFPKTKNNQKFEFYYLKLFNREYFLTFSHTYNFGLLPLQQFLSTFGFSIKLFKRNSLLYTSIKDRDGLYKNKFVWALNFLKHN